jgi:hypothetical protein
MDLKAPPAMALSMEECYLAAQPLRITVAAVVVDIMVAAALEMLHLEVVAVDIQEA